MVRPEASEEQPPYVGRHQRVEEDSSLADDPRTGEFDLFDDGFDDERDLDERHDDDHDDDYGEDDECAEHSAFDSMLSSADESAEYADGRGRRRRPLWSGWALLVVFVLVVAGGGVWLHDVVTRVPAPKPPAAPGFTITLLDVSPGSAVPSAAGPVPASVPGPHDPRTAWLNRIAMTTYIPERALAAYLNAQTVLAQRDPGCHLSWTTLAGVGWVESQHGGYDGDSIGPDDREVHPIIGPALDGTDGMRKVPATDHGQLDGDTQWAHAVGPMQFLPATWLQYGLRASSDGKAPDPQNIADAALTAGNYLCATAGDLSIPKNWWAAVYVYNNSLSYGQEVFSGADAYAKASR